MTRSLDTPLASGWIGRQLLREPRRPAAVRESPRASWFVVGTVCIGAFMGQLDASIVTVALPQMGRDLQVSLGAVEWVALAYLLVLVATVATVGRIADSVGRKLLYVYGFGVFTAGSVLCGLAPTPAGSHRRARAPGHRRGDAASQQRRADRRGDAAVDARQGDRRAGQRAGAGPGARTCGRRDLARRSRGGG